MNHDSFEAHWDVCDLSVDDASDSQSFQLVSEDHEISPKDELPSSGLPLPALHRSVVGPRFSSPYQLDSQHTAVSEVSHHCNFETGLQRPDLVHRAVPTRISALHSGGKPLPKLRPQRPSSIVSVHDHSNVHLSPMSMSAFTALDVQPTHSKRPRIATSAPQPKAVNVSRIKQASDSTLVQALWIQICGIFLHHSLFLTDLQCSSQMTEHVNRFLNQFAAGTLMKYFGALIHWHSICISSRVNPWSLSDVGLADLLSIHKLARRSDGQGPGVSVTLKALRWAVSQLQVTCLRDCVYGRIVSSFGKQRSSADRRETLPFSLFILCVWEKQILKSTTSDVDVIILSTFLLLTWSSLRFADAQRCNIEGLCYTDQVLRGICWQTKTVSNLAWGLIGNGFLSHGTFNWLHKFLRTLDKVYHNQGQSMSIDFLFPSCTDDAVRTPIQAMQYAECLYFLRKYLRLFWHKSSSEDVTLSAQSYTVHGLKSTMLSYAAQLQLPDEMRRIQGKHRAVQASTRLYSRDDVSSALHLQQIVREKVLGGWRPSTPVARGGQAPLVEPKFSLDKYRKEIKDDPWLFFQFQMPIEIPSLEEGSDGLEGQEPPSSSNSSSSSDSSSIGGTPTVKRQLHDESRGTPSLVGLHRHMWHVILSPNDQLVDSFVEQSLDGTLPECALRTACGHKLLSCKLHLSEALDLAESQMLCQHFGCKKGWISLGMI